MSLERFHEAQRAKAGGFETALAELRAGRKTSHWIWYIFPQLEGLGRSSTARFYGLRDFAEALDYLRDPVLRARLEAVTQAVAAQLEAGVGLRALMGGETDALKVGSSLTLFEAAGRVLAKGDPSLAAWCVTCGRVLEQAAMQGVSRCAPTLAHVSEFPPG